MCDGEILLAAWSGGVLIGAGLATLLFNIVLSRSRGRKQQKGDAA